jgi:translation initiation factor IF-3
VTADGENLGVISLATAISEAQKRGLDLIEISPTAVPPVAKIMDYGKYLYDEKKKQKVAKTKVVTTEVKSKFCRSLGPIVLYKRRFLCLFRSLSSATNP